MVVQQNIQSYTSIKRTITIKSSSLLIVFLATWLVGSLSLLPPFSVISFYLIKLLQVIIFLLIGYFILKKLIKPVKTLTVEKVKPLLFLILIQTTVILIVLSLLYFLFNKSAWLMAFSSSAAFALPFGLTYSWVLFNNIPKKEFKPWIPDKSARGGTSVFLDSLSVKLRVSKKLDDLHEGIYMVNVPYYIKLGDFFSRFLYEQNKTPEKFIEESDRKKKRFAWEFFVTDLYGLQQRRLDPNLSLIQNKIRQDASIRVRRLYEPLKLLKNTLITTDEVNK